MRYQKFAGVIIAGLLCLGQPVAATEWLVLSNFHLIDGTGASPVEVEQLVIRDGVIQAINPSAFPSEDQVQPMESVTHINLDGAWVMPGLIDTHVHVARFPETLKQAKTILQQAVRGGVTSVRDLGGDARTLAEVNRALLNNEWIGADVVFAGIYGGPALFADERIARLSPGFEPGTAPWTQAITDNTNLPLMVAATRGAGVHGIKLYGNLDAELSVAVIHEANRQNLPVWAHATVFPAGPGDLVNAGVSSLSHAAYLVWEAADSIPDDYSARIDGPWSSTAPDHPALIALFKTMKHQGVFLDATLYVYESLHKVIPPDQAGWAIDAARWGAAVTRLAHQQGVKITAGTDWFEPNEGELPHTHDELALLVEKAELSPMEAIVAGTRNGAESLGLLDQRGTVEADKAADLLILSENPLDNIRNTEKIQLVVKHGKVIKPERRF